MSQLLSAWETVRRHPVLLWLPVGLNLIWMVPMSLVVPDMVAYPVVTAGIGVLMLIALFVAPAVAGGYNAMVGAAATGGVPSMRSFREGWGKYYGRIVGAAVLVALIVGIFSYRSMGNYLRQGQAVSYSGFAGLLSSVLGAFGHVWLAALVINDQGILDTTASAGRSVVARFVEYLPLAGVILVVYFIPAVGRSDGIALTPVMTVLSLLSSIVKSALQAFVRVGAFTVFVGSAARAASPPPA